MPDERDRRSVEERRAQLVEAAVEVIAAEGLGRATTRRITDHADLALGAFHYAFRSKDELLEAVIARIASQMREVLRDAVPDPSIGLAPSVEQLVSGFWSFVDEAPNLHLAQYELTIHGTRDVRMRRLVARCHDGHVEVIRELLGRVPDGPAPDEAEDVARFLMSTLDGLVLHRLVSEDPDGAQRRLALFLRCLVPVTKGSG